MKKSICVACRMLVCLWFAFPVSSANAQISAEDDEWKRGYHGLNLICSGLGLEHQTWEQWKSTKPSESVLVVLGRPARNQNVVSYLNRGGRVLYATDQSEKTLRRYGFDFAGREAVVLNPRDGFEGHTDCPVVQTFDFEHPVLKDVERLVTNRPGYLVFHSRPRNVRYRKLASLPLMRSPGRAVNIINNQELLVMASFENSVDGKMLCIADQSVFSNQMLLHGQNALFSKQAIEWLKEDRKFVHVVADGVDQFPVNLANLDVEMPPPTREEVIEALENLPPSMLLEFANEIATIVEDEDMFNEFANAITERINPKAMNRFLIFLSFAMACLFAMLVFATQRRYAHQTASGIATEKFRLKKKSDKRQEFVERQMAVEALMDSFCLEASNRRYRTWTNFPEDLGLEDDERNNPRVEAMLKSMAETNVLYKSKPAKYWTRYRLLGLEHEVNHWRGYFGIEPTVEVASTENTIVHGRET